MNRIKLQLPSTNINQTATIPAFLLKLRNLLDDPSNDDLICWNNVNDGESFLLCNQTRFAKEVLPLHFKHSNLASFIRQLNMYGFKKISNIEQGGLSAKDEMEFHNPCFLRDEPALMEQIKRKGSALREKLSEYGTLRPAQVPDVLVNIQDLKLAQDSFSQQLNVLKKENSRLWQDVAKLRYQHSQQQQVINKLLHFMAAVATKCRSRKRQLPMLPLGPAMKVSKDSLDSSTSGDLSQGNILSTSGHSVGSSTANAMTIKDITDGDFLPADIQPSWVAVDGDQIPSTVSTLKSDDADCQAVVTVPDSPSNPDPKVFKSQFSENVQDVQSNIDILKDLFAHSDGLELPTDDLAQLFDAGQSAMYSIDPDSVQGQDGLSDLMQPPSSLDPPAYESAQSDLDGLMEELRNSGRVELSDAEITDLMYPLSKDDEDDDKNRPVISSHDLD